MYSSIKKVHITKLFIYSCVCVYCIQFGHCMRLWNPIFSSFLIFFFFFHYQSNKFEANLLAKVTNKCRDKYVICLKCSGVGIWKWKNGDGQGKYKCLKIVLSKCTLLRSITYFLTTKEVICSLIDSFRLIDSLLFLDDGWRAINNVLSSSFLLLLSLFFTFWPWSIPWLDKKILLTHSDHPGLETQRAVIYCLILCMI